MFKRIDQVILELIEFQKKHNSTIEELNKKIEDSEKIIFEETCFKKHYLHECEPEFCTFRILKKCTYFDELARLQAVKKK